ncbi:MAG: hypothetical protein ACI9S8_001963 [Chlamydiales bacterium]|jgi:hypothetical protein
MFFVPTVVDDSGYIINDPQGVHKEVHRSKGELLFQEIYQRDQNSANQEPCFIFIDDRKSNCKSVLNEGQKVGVATHTFKVVKPQVPEEISIISSIFGGLFTNPIPQASSSSELEIVIDPQD